MVARDLVFPAFSWNRDEPVYLWQIEGLRGGQFRPSDGGWPEFFRPWFTASEDGRFFSQYTLGWPLVLLASVVVTGSTTAGLAFGAALAVGGTYALAFELSQTRAVAVVAGTTMLACPILPIQGGIHLGYVFTLGLGTLFAAALLSGVRLHRPWRVALAGVLVGFIFLTRPYDAVLWSFAVLGVVVVQRRHELGRLVRLVPAFTAGAVPLVAVTLVYNRAVTGGFLRFPIVAADPLDTFWFGERRLMPEFGIVDYSPLAALEGTLKNGFWFPFFLAGAHVGLLVGLLHLWRRRRESSTAVLVAILVAFPLGYFVFWGTHISSLASRFSGPIYEVPLYAVLSIAIAGAVVAAWGRSPRRGAALVAVLAAATVPVAVSRIGVNREISVAYIPWRESTEDLDERALVFVEDSGPYLLHLNPFSLNDPELENSILYATDQEATNVELMSAYPDRAPYRQQASLDPGAFQPSEAPLTASVTLTPLSLLRASAVSVRIRATNPSGAPAMVAYVLAGGSRRSYPLTPGPDGSAVATVDVDHMAAGDDAVVVGVGYGADPLQARRQPFAAIGFDCWPDRGELACIVPGTARYAAEDEEGRRVWISALSVPELSVELVAR